MTVQILTMFKSLYKHKKGSKLLFSTFIRLVQVLLEIQETLYEGTTGVPANCKLSLETCVDRCGLLILV